MDDTIVSETCSEPKDEQSESTKVQEVIGRLLNSENKSHAIEQQTEFSTDPKPDEDLSDSTVTRMPIGASSPLNICHVSLTEAGMLLESGDIIQQSLDGNSSAIQLEVGTTAFVQNFEAVDESDSNDAATKFIDGQAVQLEDGSTAFIHAAPREGLQAVQLEDGTMAYLSQTGADLFNGEASGLDLDHLASPQICDEEKELDIRVEDSYSQANNSRNHEKAFQCPYDGCRRLYTTLHHLKVHERSHTGDRPFKCTAANCGKAFATGYGLKSHTRVHTGETPYKCQEESCQKAFKTSGDLQKHVRTHTGERPFKCPFAGCNRAFTTSNIRKVHIRTHTGERPYICKMDGCKRAFASATNYKNHIRIHTGEKPYICSVTGCNKRFTEYSSLYKHHVVHTHSKPYICSICGKNYRQTSTLAMHKRSVHGILEACEENGAKITAAAEKSPNSEEKDSELQDIKPELQEIVQNEEKIIVIKSANAQQEAVETTLAIGKSFPAIVALQGDNLQEHPVYAVQLQQDGTLSTSMQQILLVTDPNQLAALQQLAQQVQFEGVLTSTNADSALEES